MFTQWHALQCTRICWCVQWRPARAVSICSANMAASDLRICSASFIISLCWFQENWMCRSSLLCEVIKPSSNLSRVRHCSGGACSQGNRNITVRLVQVLNAWLRPYFFIRNILYSHKASDNQLFSIYFNYSWKIQRNNQKYFRLFSIH